MICFPNAKINLGLNIVSKRADGYHNLETIFYPVGVKDALEILVKEGQTTDTFFEEGIKIDSLPENNLVIRALRMMRSEFDFPPIEVRLLKKIPFGAGLGGGSADASFTLKLLNETFELGASLDKLAGMAVKLGADCPFFIYNHAMFATGIGEQFENIDLSLKDYVFVIIKPDIHVSTKDAFAKVQPQKPTVRLTEIIKQPIEDWRFSMKNDFEQSVFQKYPEIKAIKDELYKSGAIYASMSGSGSSVFGIFNQVPEITHITDSKQYTWKGKGL